MKAVTIEIIFKDGRCTDRIYKSNAANPTEDALRQAQEEWGQGASVIRVISINNS